MIVVAACWEGALEGVAASAFQITTLWAFEIMRVCFLVGYVFFLIFPTWGWVNCSSSAFCAICVIGFYV